MKNPAWSHSRTVTRTSQYQGGSGLASQAMSSTPNQPRTVFIRPKRTPLKIDIFQMRAAAT
ncbi:hypothetical protein SGLAM104S_03629 [Streptomyces glaucescens]